MVNATMLIEWLREMDREGGSSTLPIVRIAMNEPLFDWMSLSACTDCGCPGLDIGQDHDCRYRTDGPEGLHAQVFTKAGYVEFHLDRVDACRNLAAHGVADTRLPEGASGGAVIGLLVGAILGGGKGALVGSVAGGLAGAGVGASIPRAPRVMTEFRVLLANRTRFTRSLGGAWPLVPHRV